MKNLKKYTASDYTGLFNLKSAEKVLILRAAKKFKNNQGKIAAALEVSSATLRRKMHQHNLTE